MGASSARFETPAISPVLIGLEDRSIVRAALPEIFASREFN
jgi:hypothetical protein